MLVLRGGGGLLVEGPGWAGAFLRVGGGLAWRYSTDASVTVTLDGATHDGFAGPNRAMLGWERRFGRNRSSPAVSRAAEKVTGKSQRHCGSE